MSKAELKPCPFCGGEVSMVYNSHENAFKFYHRNGGDEDRCRVIDVIRLRGSSLKDAAEAWNRRADAVEVVHGRWKSVEARPHLIYECSICGDRWSYGAMINYNFCPNCGAKKDGE